MKYDTIVLGATFFAAGFVQGCTDECLVIERRPQAGYEFLNALKFGNGYDEEPRSDEAKVLYEKFKSKKAFNGENICLFDCASAVYGMLKGKNVLLNMEIVCVRRTAEGFEVIAHGVSGYRTFIADKVIDTRVHEDMIAAKTLNILVNSETGASFDLPIKTEKWGYEKDLTIKCPVEKSANYVEARKAASEIIKNLPADYRAAMVADMFDCEIKEDYSTKSDGIIYMPSVAYKNPLLSFDAGILLAKGELD